MAFSMNFCNIFDKRVITMNKKVIVTVLKKEEKENEFADGRKILPRPAIL